MATNPINPTIKQSLVPQDIRLGLAHGYFNQTWFSSKNFLTSSYLVARGNGIRSSPDDMSFSGAVVRLLVHLITS